MTCIYNIPNSFNVKCTKLRYIHPAMTLKNKCIANYYAIGPIESKCNLESKCESCACDATGSLTQQCDDQTGKCKCKVEAYHITEENKQTKNASYYGDKCENRHCEWGLWSPYSVRVSNLVFPDKIEVD